MVRHVWNENKFYVINNIGSEGFGENLIDSDNLLRIYV